MLTGFEPFWATVTLLNYNYLFINNLRTKYSLIKMFK